MTTDSVIAPANGTWVALPNVDSIRFWSDDNISKWEFMESVTGNAPPNEDRDTIRLDPAVTGSPVVAFGDQPRGRSPVSFTRPAGDSTRVYVRSVSPGVSVRINVSY